jgi:DNA topoisomerase-2
MKFNSEKEIIDSYFPVRLAYYQKRKDYMINSIQSELKLLTNKSRYIQETLDGDIDLRKKSKTDILQILQDKKYDMIEDDADYKYLLKMPMDSVSEENAAKLMKDRDGKRQELLDVQTNTIENMWLNELELLKQYMYTPPTTTIKSTTIKPKRK